MTLKRARRSDVPPFRALSILSEVNQRVAAGQSVMRLEAGQPSVGAPEAALDYGRERITRDPRQGYTEALGTGSLRAKIAEFYGTRYGLSVDPARVAVTVGSSGGFLLAFLSAFDVGDRVVMAAPGYPAYRNYLKALGLQAVEIETGPETNYQPTPERLDRAIAEGGRIDGLILCSPSNPCGTMISPQDLKALCAWCEANEVRLISDEVYHGITYEDPAETVLRFTDGAIVLNSFSKYFAMTGWRLGWLVLPEDLCAPVKALAENLFVSPPTLAQHVAWKIFDHTDVLDGYVATYRRNRDILRAGLEDAGIGKFARPQGAFYIYADIGEGPLDSAAFCARLLDEAGVSVTPGLDFDIRRGRQTIRLCYAGPTADIEEAVRRLKAWAA
ncbi:MAG TPA: aminotransferase class I/II-fold pyridoxal phosphate-dependent enzyme [Alphaproteobacteria bacterium]|mgnify:CR=1 FL=1|nr:aminotransferase class I/II-fold pyridoxal phosphate-dependent enzyme [Alphaproteobacteria bacterium]